jgi:hypothetical protein
MNQALITLVRQRAGAILAINDPAFVALREALTAAGVFPPP